MLRLFNWAGSERESMLVKAAEVVLPAGGVVDELAMAGAVALVPADCELGKYWSNEWKELNWCCAVAAILAS